MSDGVRLRCPRCHRTLAVIGESDIRVRGRKVDIRIRSAIINCTHCGIGVDIQQQGGTDAQLRVLGTTCPCCDEPYVEMFRPVYPADDCPDEFELGPIQYRHEGDRICTPDGEPQEVAP